MFRFQFQINVEKPKWWYKIFSCKHKVVLVEEDYDSRYGCHTSYSMCLKCRRTAMDIEKNCKHQIDTFGRCIYCRQRIEKFDCEHEQFNNEPDTDDEYCENCGEWREDLKI
jgi:hypothetical protein